MSKKKKKSDLAGQRKAHEFLAEAINELGTVEVWAGGTTPNQVRVQLRIRDWNATLEDLRLIRIAERSSNPPWKLHICQEPVLREGTDQLVLTSHCFVRADDPVTATAELIRFIGTLHTDDEASRKVREGTKGIIGDRTVMAITSYPLGGKLGHDRNIPIDGKGAVPTTGKR